jgi:hypothetical protein
MNIWQVVCVNDLIKILKESPSTFIIIGIVLETTPKQAQIEIKKFLKEKARLFPNMKFLFFKANLNDLGKISLLENDETQYPFIYHIYDTTNIFIKVNSANYQTINESFKAGEQYYKKDLEKYLSSENPQTQQNNSQNQPPNQQNKSEQNSQSKETKETKETKESSEDEWKKQHSELKSQEETLKKIITFQARAKDFNIELLKDIQQRKIEETKNKKK